MLGVSNAPDLSDVLSDEDEEIKTIPIGESINVNDPISSMPPLRKRTKSIIMEEETSSIIMHPMAKNVEHTSLPLNVGEHTSLPLNVEEHTSLPLNVEEPSLPLNVEEQHTSSLSESTAIAVICKFIYHIICYRYRLKKRLSFLMEMKRARERITMQILQIKQIKSDRTSLRISKTYFIWLGYKTRRILRGRRFYTEFIENHRDCYVLLKEYSISSNNDSVENIISNDLTNNLSRQILNIRKSFVNRLSILLKPPINWIKEAGSLITNIHRPFQSNTRYIFDYKFIDSHQYEEKALGTPNNKLLNSAEKEYYYKASPSNENININNDVKHSKRHFLKKGGGKAAWSTSSIKQDVIDNKRISLVVPQITEDCIFWQKVTSLYYSNHGISSLVDQLESEYSRLSK